MHFVYSSLPIAETLNGYHKTDLADLTELIPSSASTDDFSSKFKILFNALQELPSIPTDLTTMTLKSVNCHDECSYVASQDTLSIIKLNYVG